jgi:hypothetical protein
MMNDDAVLGFGGWRANGRIPTCNVRDTDSAPFGGSPRGVTQRPSSFGAPSFPDTMMELSISPLPPCSGP